MDERTLRGLNLAFRFILELVVLVALALWGFGVSDQLVIGLLLGLGTPAIAIVVWGTFVAPRATRRLDDPARLALEVVVFAAGVLAFIAAGRLELGVLLALAATISLVLMVLWGQRGY